jgi:hypothetical protein
MATRAKRRRYANGPPRPGYLDSPDADRAVLMILALAAEVSALRERLDTHERLAESDLPATPAAVEAYRATESVEADRAAGRHALIDRIARVLLEPDIKRDSAAAKGEPRD